MSAEPDKKEGGTSSRWWEFYAVRYAMGTVVGGILVFQLFHDSPTLHRYLMEPTATVANIGEVHNLPMTSLTTGASPSVTQISGEKGEDKGKVGQGNDGSLDPVRLLFLCVLGLIYCYIASAPILVFHAGRFLLLSKKKTSLESNYVWLILVGTEIVLLIVGILTAPVSNLWPKMSLLVAWAIPMAVVLLLQWVVLWKVAKNGGENLYEFYGKLAIRRAKATGEILESYRHLREHGNSFFIVFLEIMLAGGFYLIQGQNGKALSPSMELIQIAGVIILWILPAVLIWYVATLFELNFALDPTSGPQTPKP